MRTLIDSLIAVMLVAGVVVGVMLYHHRQQNERDIEAVRSALHRLHEQAAYHTAVQSAMAGQDTLLVHLHAKWFGEDLPTNVLLDAGHPWLDLAPPGDLGIHPPDPVASDLAQAGFWYNPTTGVFRARVKPGSSEAQTLTLYNSINGTALDAFEQLPDPARRPIAHVPGQTPARQYASMANKTWSEPIARQEAIAEDLILAATQDAPAHRDDARAAEDGLAQPTNLTPPTPTPAQQPSDAEPVIEVVDEVKQRPTLKK